MNPLKHKNIIFLFLILVGFCLFFYFDLHKYLTLNAIKKYEVTLTTWTASHYYTSLLIYTSTFTLLIAFGIPCATIMTLLGGFLFGSIAILFAAIGTTLGGFILYLVVRNTIGKQVALHSKSWMKALKLGFQHNAFSYLISLRLVPIFPCWISNIGAGALDVPAITFLTATVIGILPSTVIYALAGRGLDKIIEQELPLAQILFAPSILLPLIGLVLIALFPVIYRLIKKYRQH